MKSKKMSIRISEEDLDMIHRKARRSLLTLTEYVTTCCLDKQIVVIDGLHEVIRLQKTIGRNLNQLTTLANMGRVRVVNLQELTEQHIHMSNLLSEILKRKRWDDGDG